MKTLGVILESMFSSLVEAHSGKVKKIRITIKMRSKNPVLVMWKGFEWNDKRFTAFYKFMDGRPLPYTFFFYLAASYRVVSAGTRRKGSVFVIPNKLICRDKVSTHVLFLIATRKLRPYWRLPISPKALFHLDVSGRL